MPQTQHAKISACLFQQTIRQRLEWEQQGSLLSGSSAPQARHCRRFICLSYPLTLSRNLHCITYFVLEHLSLPQLLAKAVNGVHQLPAFFQYLATVILQSLAGEAFLQILFPGNLLDKEKSEIQQPSNSILTLSPQPCAPCLTRENEATADPHSLQCSPTAALAATDNHFSGVQIQPPPPTWRVFSSS